MKIINNIRNLVMLLMLIGFVSCSEKEENLFLKRNVDALSFTYLGSTKDLAILSNGNWKVSTDDDWIGLSPSEGTGDGKNEQYIQITVTQNTDDERTGSITLFNDEKSFIIEISQSEGHFSLGKATIPSSFIINEDAAGEKIQIPYLKAKAGDRATVNITLDGIGAAGLSVESLTDYLLAVGEGTIPVNIGGTPTTAGEIQVHIHTEVLSRGFVSDTIIKSRTKEVGGVDPIESPTVSTFKILPRLAVLDWGDYEKGTGTCGANGTSRKFVLELATSQFGAAIRRYASQVDWLNTTSTAALPTFYEHNRFAFGALTPNTTYWFRIVVKTLDATKNLDSDVTYFQFTTPAEEPLAANVLLYKDFDNFWFGGCPIYQAFAVMPTEAQIGTNIDPAADAIKSNDYRTTYAVNNIGDMFAQVNNATHNIGPTKAAALWNFCWEGDKYGTNYADANYAGWTGSLALPNTGGVRLASASAQGYIKTPKLTAIGEDVANITVTVHTAPYFEPYQSWGEDHLQHFIIVEGPGVISDGGSTKAEPVNQDPACANTDKQVTVAMQSNVNSATKGPSKTYTVPTQHTVSVSGATKDTRIVIKTHPYSGVAHYRIFVDDIKITKD